MSNTESMKEPIIVGIGASAGGFEALQQFVQNISKEGKLSYIIIPHFDSNHPTLLMNFLSSSCRIPITQAKNGQIIQSNHVYLCPPNTHITLQKNNVIKLNYLQTSVEPKCSINLFFASLAKQLKNKAIGILFSGTGSDGAKGVLAIKNAGGLTLVELEKSGKYPSFTKENLDIDEIDFLLKPIEIAKSLALKYSSQDIIRLIQKQQLIQQRETRLTKILDGTDNILILQNKECEIIHINQQFFKFFTEYKNIEAFTKEHTSLFELFDHDDEMYLSQGVFKANFPKSLNERMQRKVKITREGVTYYFRVTVSPVSLEPGQEEFVFTLSDVTELEHEMQKNLQQERILQQQAKMASMGEMIGNIAHQWRQPLNSLASLNTLLMLDYKEENKLSQEQLEEYSQHTNMLIQKMSSTIDDFRNFFIPKNKQLSHFKLYTIVVNSLKLVRDTYKQYDIKLELNIDKSLALKSYQSELEQVLLNLLNNAKDAHMEHKTPNPYVWIEAHENQEHIELYLKDNAGGIDEKIINKVFEPYFSTKFEDEGTGIGLYMSKMIVEESLNGKLKLENHDNGVLITLQLPKILDSI